MIEKPWRGSGPIYVVLEKKCDQPIGETFLHMYLYAMGGGLKKSLIQTYDITVVTLRCSGRVYFNNHVKALTI